MFLFLDIEDLLENFYELVYRYCNTLVTVNNKRLNNFMLDPFTNFCYSKFPFRGILSYHFSIFLKNK